MSYTTKDIRNVAIMGHGHSGKTTVVESMLYVCGAIDRLGTVSDGNTVCDYDQEEINRGITISTSVVPLNYKNVKINILDTPGYFDFVGDMLCALRAVEAGMIVVPAKETAEGVSVGAERCWNALKTARKPAMFCVSKCREENADFMKAFETLKERFGNSLCPLTFPTAKMDGVVNLLENCAYISDGMNVVKKDIPEEDKERTEELHAALAEAAAGASEELMEKFFNQDMTLEMDDIIAGLQTGFAEGSVVPVFASDATANIGTASMLFNIMKYCPAPVEERGDTTAFVFKTINDKFGKYNFLKVTSGTVHVGDSLRNLRTGSDDKIGRLYNMIGKKTVEVTEAVCGDIVAVGKMDWKTNDTVSSNKETEPLPPVDIPEPCYSLAIEPKTKGQDDKVAAGLGKLNEEDISFTLVNNPETHQMVISGTGDIQISVLTSKLKNVYGVETVLTPARVAYREKIKGKVEAHGRHKKQSGGSGQFGDVWIRFEPQDESDEMIFAEEVFGGSVPKNFFPSVEKGLRNAVQKGVLAGYPLVGLKATLYDGSYHPVDSNDMAFQTAARLAYQDGIPKAKPTILEPIGHLLVTIPDDFQGAIIADINSKRRGTMLGSMPGRAGMTTIEAEVPMAEMTTYTIDLRSMTQGAGSFNCKFARYEEAPSNVQQKIIEEAKKLAENG